MFFGLQLHIKAVASERPPSGGQSIFIEVQMLRSLFPKAHHKFLSLPLLGPIADGFDDWLAASGYTPGSREFAVRMLPHVDADLRRRRVRDVASLTHAKLHACWRGLIKVFPIRGIDRLPSSIRIRVLSESP